MGVLKSIVILCLVAIVSLSYAQELDYGIMIDAGSSGCRIYLYDWPHRENNTLPLVEPTINQTIISKKNNNPLNGFINNPAAAGPSLKPLIEYILYNLSPDKYSTTPIYLKATAGMRALNITMQTLIMASVQKYLATTPFEFQPNYARVIPGTDEGIFGWITTNYAMALLQKGDPTNTYGALDMGGASTQITFVPQSPPKMDGFDLALGLTDYFLYTYSYPLGQDVSLNIILNYLIETNTSDRYGNIANPCYLLGYNETFNNRLIVGTANNSACILAIETAITVKNASCTSCGVAGVYQPQLWGNYFAFSGFAYTFSFFGLTNTSTIEDLNAATKTFCSTWWPDAVAEYNSTSPEYLKFYCFTGTYYSNLLTRGYGFDASQTNITVTSMIGDIELTWALGGMIYEASLLPFGPIHTGSHAFPPSTHLPSTPPPRTQPNTWMSLFAKIFNT